MKLKDKTLFLLDMDGTIYHENDMIDGAMDFLRTVKEQGKTYVFMTNNSSKSAKAYIDKLNRLGIEAERKHIASSVDATVLYLNQHKPGAKIYLVGTESLKSELIENGFEVVPVDYRGEDVDYVLLGFDMELYYAKLEGACYYVCRNYPYIATNCDLCCPIPDNKYIPDCGSMAKLINDATGRMPQFLGKPDRTIVDVVAKRFNTPYENMVCVGDRVYTDIAVGVNAGIDSVCVLSGEATLADIEASSFKPTYIMNSIKDLYEEIK